MIVQAKISERYLWWLGLISLFCLGFALWFAYDGLIAYPATRTEQAVTYEELKKEDLPLEARERQWREIATKRGWSLEHPGEPRSMTEIRFQLVLGALSAIPGLLWLFFLLRARGRWIELNETGLRTSWGQQLEFDQIATLDKKKWKAKGIARIRYEQEGRRRTLVLDDWKYDAESTEAILREVESRIEPGQITGGPPLPPLEEETEGELEGEVEEQGEGEGEGEVEEEPADPSLDEEPT